MGNLVAKYDVVAAASTYNTWNLSESGSAVNISLVNMSIVPTNLAAPCNVIVILQRNGIDYELFNESLAAGDKLYDNTTRTIFAADKLIVQVSAPVYLTIFGSWFT